MSKLEIINLEASVDGKKILNGVNLTINSGEVHAILGPNGTGKSTLMAVIMGHPKYEVLSGEVLLDGENVLEMEVDERSKAGLFLGMQYPAEIAGISNSDFLRAATKAHGEEETLIKYIRRLESNVEGLKMPKEMVNRNLNEGFSGGEKKKNEILQLKMIKPKFSLLDEIDSGLDLDALSVVGESLTKEMEERKNEMGMLIITHYKRLLDYIKPTHVHVMLSGIIVESGDVSLVDKLEVQGYDKLKEKYKIVDEDKKISIGSCATSTGVNNG